MAVMRVLLGESPPPLLHMTASKAATETIYQVARIQQKYWKNIKAPPLEPYPGIFTSHDVIKFKLKHVYRARNACR